MVIELELGALILKSILKCKANNSIGLDSDIIDFVKDFINDAFEQREIVRKFQKIEDDISKSCKEVLSTTNLNVERQEAIYKVLIDTLRKLNLSVELLFEINTEQNRLKMKMLNASDDYLIELEGKEQEIYIRMLDHISYIIINDFIQFPEFSIERSEYLIMGIDSIVEKNENIINELEQINGKIIGKPEQYRNFEREYRKNIITQYSYIYLFGADDIKHDLKRYKLSSAYVQLEIQLNEIGKKIEMEKIFVDKRKFIWLTGEAGAGKTTFISWVAINSANNEVNKIEGLNNTIPIIIELRKYKIEELSIIECINRIMSNSTYSIPEGWIEEAIMNGRIVFLIDGFDEIPEEERQKVFDWINDRDEKNSCKKVFTSRPQVKNRPRIKGLSEVKIMPMNPQKVSEFIKYWHRAVLSEQLKKSEVEVIVTQNNLFEIISRSESLSKLATNPLLCAMITSLHYRSGMNIPNSKRELYEACCKMLLESRDAERKIDYRRISISYEKKKLILAKLACNMMRNNTVEINQSDAIKFLNTTVEDMGLENFSGEELLQYLLERTGLIRNPEYQKIDFVHKSFQEYLCAVELSRQGEWGFIKQQIGKEAWLETVSLAIGYATKDQANEILHDTLEFGRVRKQEKKYLFYALEYLTGTLEVNPTIRKIIYDKLEVFLPPKKQDIEQIAISGDLAVPHLEYKKTYKGEERKNCISTLALIATRKSLHGIKTYFVTKLSEEEIIIIGSMFNLYRDEELIEEKIPELVKKYILENEEEKIVISSGMIRVMNLLEKSELDCLAKSMIKELKILDYEENGLEEYFLPVEICNNIHFLTIDGYFETLVILYLFNNLDNLTLYARSEKFDFYDLNKFSNIYNIKNFKLVLYKMGDTYICGKDLAFLHKCEQLFLVFLGDAVELYFTNFNELTALKKLSIAAEYASEFDYKYLRNLKGFKELEIICHQEAMADYSLNFTDCKFSVKLNQFERNDYF